MLQALVVDCLRWRDSTLGAPLLTASPDASYLGAAWGGWEAGPGGRAGGGGGSAGPGGGARAGWQRAGALGWLGQGAGRGGGGRQRGGGAGAGRGGAGGGAGAGRRGAVVAARWRSGDYLFLFPDARGTPGVSRARWCCPCSDQETMSFLELHMHPGAPVLTAGTRPGERRAWLGAMLEWAADRSGTMLWKAVKDETGLAMSADAWTKAATARLLALGFVTMPDVVPEDRLGGMSLRELSKQSAPLPESKEVATAGNRESSTAPAPAPHIEMTAPGTAPLTATPPATTTPESTGGPPLIQCPFVLKSSYPRRPPRTPFTATLPATALALGCPIGRSPLVETGERPPPAPRWHYQWPRMRLPAQWEHKGSAPEAVSEGCAGTYDRLAASRERACESGGRAWS